MLDLSETQIVGFVMQITMFGQLTHADQMQRQIMPTVIDIMR